MTNKQAQITINAIKFILDNAQYSEDVEEALNMAISALTEQRWIPCSERLPDHNADVLVTDADKTEMGRRSDGRWLDCYGDKMKDVTAWMPKPKPYREGEG